MTHVDGNKFDVATVPTVYGIETFWALLLVFQHVLQLQQYLPFTVLKPHEIDIAFKFERARKLQQYLPFTVLKHLYHDKYLL